MKRVDLTGLYNIQAKIGNFRWQKVASPALYVMAGEIADTVRDTLEARIKNPTGKVAKGLTVYDFEYKKGGVQTKVGFLGYHTDEKGRQVPNAIIAAVLESGRSDQAGRDKTHFFSDAVKMSKDRAMAMAVEKMEQKIEQYIGD